MQSAQSGLAAASAGDDETWWDEQVGELLARAARRRGREPDDDDGALALADIRMLLDTAIEHLQDFTLHNPCGDGEVIELPDGSEACAGCFQEDGNPRD